MWLTIQFLDIKCQKSIQNVGDNFSEKSAFLTELTCAQLPLDQMYKIKPFQRSEVIEAKQDQLKKQPTN